MLKYKVIALTIPAYAVAFLENLAHNYLGYLTTSTTNKLGLNTHEVLQN